MSQNMEALAKANSIRLARADLKESIGRGDVHVLTILSDTPEWAEGMKVAQLLESQRQWGESRARKAMVQARISPHQRLIELSRRQLDDLRLVLS